MDDVNFDEEVLDTDEEVLENYIQSFDLSASWQIRRNGFNDSYVTRKIKICDGTYKILKINNYRIRLYQSYHKRQSLFAWSKDEGQWKLKEELGKWIGGSAVDLEKAYDEIGCLFVWITIGNDRHLSLADRGF
jgi:hypothetical protein